MTDAERIAKIREHLAMVEAAKDPDDWAYSATDVLDEVPWLLERIEALSAAWDGRSTVPVANLPSRTAPSISIECGHSSRIKDNHGWRCTDCGEAL